MFKLIIFSILLLSIISPNNTLYGYDDVWYEVYGQHTVTLGERTTSLDFSKNFPLLKTLFIKNQYIDHEPYHTYLAKDDMGLRENVNLKEVDVTTEYTQIPVSLSYLPNVEIYTASAGYVLDDFSYLSQVFPFLKTLNTGVGYDHSPEKLIRQFENIGKLKYLEHFNFNVQNWPLDSNHRVTLPDQAIEALSKMYNLKKLTFEIVKYTYEDDDFNQEQLRILRSVLPNTEVTVNYYYLYDSYD